MDTSIYSPQYEQALQKKIDYYKNKTESIDNEEVLLHLQETIQMYRYINQAKTNKAIKRIVEQYIITDPHYACYYALQVLKTRWLEAEAVIMTNPQAAFMYVNDILKERWLEAEAVIMTDPEYADYYLKMFPEARTPSKDVPLVLGNYAIMDVPNTITDEDVAVLLNSTIFRGRLYPPNRCYFEPTITAKLADGKLKQITLSEFISENRPKKTTRGTN